MTPHLRPVAGHALLVEYAEAISDLAHAAVLDLDAALRAHPFDGLVETVPAFVNLLITFDPLRTDPEAIARHLSTLPIQAQSRAGQAHEVAITYDGPDLAEVAARTGLTPPKVAALHAAATYKVCLYGFAPGYAYLGGLPPALRLDRKTAPLRDVPAGSVIIAGGQCLITTLTMPTGWWIIGHSPVKVLTGDARRPFLFAVGDTVRFAP
ncbi:allophanate hydrolase subunit 1 [Rhodobacter sp. KR11]|jgi:inhibitor of KinA|uniref:5-oxoprolinase subunit B family protein n=1 Tax=Rhodobacter sp. KR11 TaxID=2974588 RepID=UPI00222201C7|nr:allophanate hydrolase subunit 1 [Rhodobacter sp. KR11]MCW1918536.1 allophanate hydrolase subunit 1 [Rhodobacter sp. KR11]